MGQRSAAPQPGWDWVAKSGATGVFLDVMDYRAFLSGPTREVLPYLGGAHVVTTERRFRVTGELELGWWSFELRGRRATAVERAEAPILESRPRVTGHLSGERLFVPGGGAELVHLLPADEPLPFCPCSARRWHSEDLVFEIVELESEAEEATRRAYEDGTGLTGIRGVPATLRAAFGFAVAERVARAHQLSIHPAEVASRLLEIAERGSAAVAPIVDEIIARREQFRARALAARARAAARQAERQRQEQARNPVARADRALVAAGAEPLSIRRRGAGQLEVRYRFHGARFQTIVDAESLQVIDAGFCLAGADSELTLESLPSAIREAIDTNQMHAWGW